jgi:hypothetical protein
MANDVTGFTTQRNHLCALVRADPTLARVEHTHARRKRSSTHDAVEPAGPQASPPGGDAAGGAGVFFYTSMALADPARLRNSNFWILPVLVLGSSPKTT